MTSRPRSDLLRARWLGRAGSELDFDLRHALAARNDELWDAVLAIARDEASAPRIIGVHSANGRPATLGRGTDTVIVWDAGLGTYLAKLATLLRSPQAAQSAETVMLEVCSARLYARSKLKQAAALKASELRLREQIPLTPFLEDRANEATAFNRFLDTELQERFLLAHEHIHYLGATNPSAFRRLETLYFEVLGKAALAKRLSVRGSVTVSEAEWWRSGVNPDSWYADSEHHASVSRTARESGVSVVHRISQAIEWDPALSEELVCDAFGALASCVDSHRRQYGWSAARAAATAAFGLQSFAALRVFDATLVGSDDNTRRIRNDLEIRVAALQLMLPLLFSTILDVKGGAQRDEVARAPSERVLSEVMHRAVERGAQLHQPSLERVREVLKEVSAEPQRPTQPVEPDAIDFAPFRPVFSPKALWKLELGDIVATPSVEALIRADPKRWDRYNALLSRHRCGDWGEVYEEDAEENDQALWREYQAVEPSWAFHHRGPIYSHYRDGPTAVLIITRRDRTRTTILLPNDL